MKGQAVAENWYIIHVTQACEPDFHGDETKLFCELRICELGFGEFLNGELFLTKVSGIHLHESLVTNNTNENQAQMMRWKGWDSTYMITTVSSKKGHMHINRPLYPCKLSRPKIGDF